MHGSPTPPGAERSQAMSGLPGTSPPAPWTLTWEGLLWLHRAAPTATGFHQSGLTFDRSVPITVGGLARYHDSPVGPYSEVWGAPTLVVRGRTIALGVPFMAVDSLASLHGGRSNWALPKRLATFGPDGSAVGEDATWSVRARVASAGIRVPFRIAGHLLQATADGDLRRSRAVARGVGRPARVQVETTGASLPEWLTAGRHLGFAVERATLVVGAALVASDG